MGGLEILYLLWFVKKYGNKFFDKSTPIGNIDEDPHFTTKYIN